MTEPYIEQITPPEPNYKKWARRIAQDQGFATLGVLVLLSMKIDPDWFEGNIHAVANSPCYLHVRQEFMRRMAHMKRLMEERDAEVMVRIDFDDVPVYFEEDEEDDSDDDRHGTS